MTVQTIQGYYDGVHIRALETVTAKPNQKVVIEITDEFIDPVEHTEIKNLRGVLSAYANPALREKEKGAWERAAAEKYGDL